MSGFERLLEPGCTERPACRCGKEMEIARVEQLPDGSDADVRVYRCAACQHEMRATAVRLHGATSCEADIHQNSYPAA